MISIRTKTMALTAIGTTLALISSSVSALGRGFDPYITPPKTWPSTSIKDDLWKLSGKVSQASGVLIAPSWIMSAKHVILSQPAVGTRFYGELGSAEIKTCYWPSADADVVICQLKSAIPVPAGTVFPPLVEDPRRIAPSENPARYQNAFGELLRVGYGYPELGSARYVSVDALGIPFNQFPANKKDLGAPAPYADSGDSGGPTFWYPPSQNGAGGLVGVQTGPGAIRLEGAETLFSVSTLQSIQTLVTQYSNESVRILTATQFYGGTPQLNPSQLAVDSLRFEPSTVSYPIIAWNGVVEYAPANYVVYLWNATRGTSEQGSIVAHRGANTVHRYIPTNLNMGSDYIACIIPSGPGYAPIGESRQVLGKMGASDVAFDYSKECKAFFMSGPATKITNVSLSIAKVSSKSTPQGYYYAVKAAWTPPTAASSAPMVLAGYRIYTTTGSDPEVRRDELQFTEPSATSAYVGFGSKYCISIVPITAPGVVGQRGDTACIQVPAQ